MNTSNSPLIVVADDDPMILKVMQHHLQSWGYRTVCVTDSARLLRQLSETPPQLLLLDLRFGESDGLEVLTQVLQKLPNLPVIMLTAHGSIDTAVQAVKRGVFDYLTKPPDLQRMREVISRALQVGGAGRPADQPPRLLGNSPAMVQLQQLIASVAPTDATVLILGESGTGKELVARALHEQSPRSKGPFVPVNMAALPRELVESVLFGHEKGAFTGAVQAQVGCCESADSGTLFLDEIGEMDLNLQAKLLRFLQERTIQRVGSTRSKTVDVRVVAATNRDLLEQCRKGLFREDLYYRLNVVPINLPPLRERQGDVKLLAEQFLRRFAQKYRKPLQGFTDEAAALLAQYDWPGNVRQLENLVERLAILCQSPFVGADLLPPELRTNRAIAPAVSASSGESVLPTSSTDSGLRPIDEMERRAICEALQRTAGNVREAARLLGMGQATVYRKLKRYNIDPDHPELS
jgi:two-component system response regulator HydG